MIFDKVFVGPSRISGKGLLARRDLGKDEIIFRLQGPVIRYNFSPDYRLGPHWINVGENTWIIPTAQVPWRYINHSCTPNSGLCDRRQVVAMRRIRKNEEVTIDYSCTESFASWKMKCCCGLKDCRRVIRSVQFLPDELFRKYHDYIPSFLRKVYEQQKFYVFSSNQKKGVFAKHFLPSGTYIFTVEGPVIHYPYRPHSLTGPLWLAVNEKSWIVPLKNNPWCFMHHSCSGNTGLIRRNRIVALKDIAKDEEITIDDSITEADLSWREKCSCGSHQCRKIVRSIQFLPEHIYQSYLPYIPTYLQKVHASFQKHVDRV